MDYRYAVGADVEFRPIGGKVGLFKVLRQMPEEQQGSSVRKYRIKSVSEEFERTVSETELDGSETGIFRS